MIKALICGIIIGIIFAVMRLPIPAPSKFNGLIGIFGIFLGHYLWEIFYGIFK